MQLNPTVYEKRIKKAFQEDNAYEFVHSCIQYFLLYQKTFHLIDLSMPDETESNIKEMYYEYFINSLAAYIENKEGFVYIANYPMINHKNVYKIGFTKDTAKRLKSLNNASVMGEIVICDSFYCKNASLAEYVIHNALQHYQVDKEFFQLEYSVIKSTIEAIIHQINLGLSTTYE